MSVLCIAHRGGAALFPENTIAAFRNALALGCDGAELDVQLSHDGEVVVFHDFRLKPEICRDAEGRWLQAPAPRIKDLTLAQLQRYKLGRAHPDSSYARAHPLLREAEGERIPTLAEVVAAVRSGPFAFRLFVELKTSFADPSISADPKELAEATLRVLCREGYLGRATLVGFDWSGLLYAKQLEPSVECWFTTQPQSWFEGCAPPPEDEPLPESVLQILRDWARSGTSPWAAGYDAVNYGGSILRAIKAAGADGWFPMYRDLTSNSVAEARSLGLKVGAWTVNEPADMRRLMDLGVDAICTDRPDLLRRIANRN